MFSFLALQIIFSTYVIDVSIIINENMNRAVRDTAKGQDKLVTI